jgi:hypothetical protein
MSWWIKPKERKLHKNTAGNDQEALENIDSKFWIKEARK